MSTVYFAPVKTGKESLLEKMGKLYRAAGMDRLYEKDELVAIKMHFGEEGNTGFLHPVYVRQAVKLVKESGALPFLTDSNTLYKGRRSNAPAHIQTAIEHGFDYAVTGAPVIIADGLHGKDYTRVSIDGKHFREVHIGNAAMHSDGLLVLTHFKGHMMTGFGGSLKNVGMGFGSRSGKQMMHSSVLPAVDTVLCTACGNCVKWCPAGAIEIVERSGKKTARIDEEICYGCGECRVTCREEAIGISWEGKPEEVQEKIVEHVKGALLDKQGKAGFFNFLLNISPDCDCWTATDASIVPDIGILASTDPVALDSASLDLVNKARGLEESVLADPAAADKFRAIYPHVNERRQLEYAKELGLGEMTYKLERI